MSQGFPESEFQTRTTAAQARMGEAGLAAILLTTEPEIRYFTGYLTRFWESPSRPWFLIVPASGKPVAVIPSIGAALMGKTWVDDIRTWSAPEPADDGVTLLAAALRELAAEGKVGLPSGAESHLRMPLTDFERVKAAAGMEFTDDRGIVATLRMVKSAAEIEKISAICAIAGRAFGRVGEIAREGVPLTQVFRDFQRLLLEEGADWVPYLSGGADQDGYGDVISPASHAPLRTGDVMMLDTGAVLDGYFCDYDRNFAISQASDAAKKGHARLIEATHAGLEAARVGARASDVWKAMADIVGGGEGVGRMGHGLGMQLTEGLSLTSKDHTILQAGMVITLEPGVGTGAETMMVHEENIVIEASGPRLLSPLATAELPVI
ncbi:Xaa-Pro peptidase family protein [uncultured Roseovarius sp.]|uniref:M24 family metallopeptidase n=1 Tax=uncultured Roseovarius sp. TaxID=293344 RepID=UPI0026038E2C|nr:Xaa-Pro peptidase family protein [uncultured Roseovarius sp.]